MWENTPVELERCHQGGLDVHVGVDEAWYGDTAAALDLACAAILPVGADDGGAADCAMSVGISAPVTRSKRRTFLITRSAGAVPRPWVMRAASVLRSILIGHSHVLGPHREPESKSGISFTGSL